MLTIVSDHNNENLQWWDCWQILRWICFAFCFVSYVSYQFCLIATTTIWFVYWWECWFNRCFVAIFRGLLMYSSFHERTQFQFGGYPALKEDLNSCLRWTCTSLPDPALKGDLCWGQGRIRFLLCPCSALHGNDDSNWFVVRTGLLTDLRYTYLLYRHK